MLRHRSLLVLTTPVFILVLMTAIARSTEGGTGIDVVKSVDESSESYRVPVDIAWQRDHLFVANSRSGTVSRIEPTAGRVTAEWAIARSLSGICYWRGELLLLDDHSHRLIRAVTQPPSDELQIADTTLILISGMNQVAFRTARHLPFERLKTGRRPESICLDDTQQRAFIVNRFDDSVTVISLAGESPVVESTISLGKRRSLSAAEQGEQTFYDASVSLDGWFSCHSCHTDVHTNGQRADTFGDEDRGAPKKVVSLLGTASAGPWAWNGSKAQLEEQIKTSLIISMQTQIETEELPIPPLAAYLQTLESAPSLRDARGLLNADLQSAKTEFERSGCRSCHSGSAFTSSEVFDVGIHDEMGETLFNPPSLRGVSQRAPYFHDGRAASLQDVLKTSHHNPENGLTDDQIQRLTLLLESL